LKQARTLIDTLIRTLENDFGRLQKENDELKENIYNEGLGAIYEPSEAWSPRKISQGTQPTIFEKRFYTKKISDNIPDRDHPVIFKHHPKENLRPTISESRNGPTMFRKPNLRDHLTPTPRLETFGVMPTVMQSVRRHRILPTSHATRSPLPLKLSRESPEAHQVHGRIPAESKPARHDNHWDSGSAVKDISRTTNLQSQSADPGSFEPPRASQKRNIVTGNPIGYENMDSRYT
jgi:hypothetical protein